MCKLKINKICITRFIGYTIYLYFILILTQNNQLINAQSTGEGEDCQTPNGREGTCKLINNCLQVYDDIINDIPHKRCGFKRRVEIVCCPKPQVVIFSRKESPSPASVSNRISARYCDEYKSAVYDTFFTTRINKCGHDVIPLIVGGQLAGPKEFPHMALLGYMKEENKFFPWCGGSIISPKFILTAAHCHYYESIKVQNVVVGDLDYDTNEDNASPENIEILTFTKHPKFNRRKKLNDIALVELRRNININPYRRPACLPESLYPDQIKFIATGWGLTEWEGDRSSELQKVVLEKFTNSECKQSYQNAFVINDELQICAGSRNDSRDTCRGDSGGPIQFYHPTIDCMYIIAGVTSYGTFCGMQVPGVYTRVYSYLDWIENIVWTQ